MLGGIDMDDEPPRDLDEIDLFSAHDEPQLATPEVDVLLELAKVRGPSDSETRAVVIRAMRKAAEKRTAGVTGKGRRRYYWHAASLATTCAEVDGTARGAKWLAAVRAKHRRYPALQREFDARERRR
jgi:hypothetical protein